MKTFQYTRNYSLVITKKIHENRFSKYQHKSQYQHKRQYKRLQTWHIRGLSLQSLFLLCVNILPLCSAVGYSYTRFVGPVRGPEQVYVTDDPVSGRQHLDYIAKPEYEFSYGVEDTEARILHNRNEIRDGDDVKGVYSLVDPDGTLRVVRYTADNVNGFKAEVITNGLSTIHGQQLSPFPSISPSTSSTPSSPPTQSVNVYHPVLGFKPDLQRFPNPSYSNQRPPQLPPTLLPITFHPQQTPQLYHKNNQNTEQKEYRPQYKVHESQEEDAEDHDDDSSHDYDEKRGKQTKKKEKDNEHHDYDSEEEEDDLEDYDENDKKNTAYQEEENDEDY
uniref:Uncharacterized protein n=1 Tax=Glossina brevipalpis TaxID=37001 RepID=A0A1A9WCX5_9MUSC